MNGKIYRPHDKGNYLVLALMKTEEDDLTKIFSGKARKSEVSSNEQLLESLQSHFEVSDPFVLNENQKVEDSENIGSLEKGVYKDTDGLAFVAYIPAGEAERYANHDASDLRSKSFPKVNLQDIKYIVPMITGCIDGYYEVESIKLSVSTDDGKVRVNYKLGEFHELGKGPALVFKMGEKILINHSDTYSIKKIRDVYKEASQG